MFNPSQVFIKPSSKQRLGSFGQQIQQKSPAGILQASIKWNQKPKWQKAENFVNKFIEASSDQYQNFRMFKNVLNQKVIDGKQSVKSYNLNQIADFLPWVFSTQFMFEPLRSIIYCLKVGIQPGNAVDVAKTVPSELINNVVDEAVLQSIKYQNSFLQVAKNLFNENQNSVTKIYAISINFLATAFDLAKKRLEQLSNSDAVVSFYNVIKDYLPSTLTFGKSQKQELKQLDSGWKKTIMNFCDQIFKDLRAYGKIVINFGYLKRAAQIKNINGKQFYFFWDHPNLLISCSKSFIEVYLSTNGTLKLIPEGQFDIQFLKSIVVQDVIKMGGRLYKNLKIQTTKTEQQRQPFENFKQKYLKWN